MWSRGRRTESVLVVECEAFLAGRYAQYLDTKNLRVPDWAWLNVLAHGSQDDIATLASGNSPPPRLLATPFGTKPWPS